MMPPVFLGGACGRTTWRTDIAIPILEAAGVPYFNPQLPEGAWTPAHQYVEMEVKDAADVWLFVFTGDTRGVASIGEVAYRIGSGRKIALMMEDIPETAQFEGRTISESERNDLNRGRVYLRAMAEAHQIPVFDNVADAARHTVELAQQAALELSIPKVLAIIEQVQVPGFQFTCEMIGHQVALFIRQNTPDRQSNELVSMTGRHWLLPPDSSEADVVRTMLKAAITWSEHEIREHFEYRGNRPFQPHGPLDGNHTSHP
jgi:hypothetical protein